MQIAAINVAVLSDIKSSPILLMPNEVAANRQPREGMPLKTTTPIIIKKLFLPYYLEQVSRHGLTKPKITQMPNANTLSVLSGWL